MKKSTALKIAFLLVPLIWGAPAGVSAGVAKTEVIREYHPNGSIQRETRYKNGQIVSKKIYNEDGKILLDYRYKDGDPYYQRQSYPDGKKKMVWTKKSGVIKSYYPDGALKSVVEAPAPGL